MLLSDWTLIRPGAALPPHVYVSRCLYIVLFLRMKNQNLCKGAKSAENLTLKPTNFCNQAKSLVFIKVLVSVLLFFVVIRIFHIYCRASYENSNHEIILPQ